MSGLWSFPTKLTGDSFAGRALLARVVINIIFVPAILWALSRQHSIKTQSFHDIRVGTFLLLIWYTISIIDLFLHETQLKTDYGYILLAFFLACFRFASDIFLVSASHRIVSTQLYDCYQVKRLRAKIWLMFGELLVIVLVISNLYYLGSLLSNEVLWLEVANADIVRDIVSHRNLFELAFFAIQFILTFGTLAVTGLLWWFRRMELVDDKAVYFTIGATLALWTRSFSELVVSTKYHPVPDGTSAAREAIYGLCTAAFLYLIKSTDKDLNVSTDPLQEQIEENTRRYILQAVERDISAGHKLPVLRTILSTINNNPNIALSADTRQEIDNLSREEKNRVTRVHQTVLVDLVLRYGNLGEPEAERG